MSESSAKPTATDPELDEQGNPIGPRRRDSDQSYAVGGLGRSYVTDHDYARRQHLDAARVAAASGVSTATLIVDVIMARRDLSLPGMAQYRLAGEIAKLIDGEPGD